MDIYTNVKYLKGVGDVRAKQLARLGVFTVRDLLNLFPRAYEDWSRTVSIEDAPQNENCCIRAWLSYPFSENLIRKGMTLYKSEATDGKSVMKVTIFNNKYLARKLIAGDEYLFFGKVSGSRFYREMASPMVETVSGGMRIRPIYPQTQTLSSRFIEHCVSTALDLCDDLLPELLPDDICKAYKLYSAKDAYRCIHFPPSEEKMLEARRSLIFRELLVLRLGLLLMRGRSKSRTKSRVFKDSTSEFCTLLPFELTRAQKRSINEALVDMASGYPMSRLLQGDVGSGKTAVAAALMFSVQRCGMQSALMAPTEILARQHFETLSKLLDGSGVTVELLVGSTPAAEKKKIKQRLKNGETDVVIGTHALIQQDVEFSRLALVVTDEQHRFGVRQRSALASKGDNAHMLVMSATPIPRTLALMVYGDLDISVLDELPPGRQRIETYCVASSLRKRVYGYVRDHLDRGMQGYIVCPLVEQSDMLDLAAAEEYAAKLANGEFSGYRVGLLHGKMKAAEKEKVMADFAGGRLQLLVSTTVIEVGVDVPNAVIMVVENAERFGLSQLHQLRGRVGRGEHKSSCILISDSQNETAKKRLKTMCKTDDGFKIAEEDLKLRGPGDFFGSRQHGLPELKIADMLTDMAVLEQAAGVARQILEKDSKLAAPENAVLKEAVLRLFENVGSGSVS